MDGLKLGVLEDNSGKALFLKDADDRPVIVHDRILTWPLVDEDEFLVNPAEEALHAWLRQNGECIAELEESYKEVFENIEYRPRHPR